MFGSFRKKIYQWFQSLSNRRNNISMMRIDLQEGSLKKMQSKKFYGKTLPEILKKIREELGEDALIINTSHLKKGGLLGIGSHYIVEVEAVSSQDSSEVESLYPRSSSLSKMEEEVKKLTEEVKAFIRGNPSQQPQDPLFEALLQKGLHQNIAKNLIEESSRHIHPSSDLVERMLVARDILAQKIPVAKKEVSTKKPYICALIGPTGVGKTTTLAKLAARFKLQEKKEVGFYTLDTYRVAAIDQLSIYAKIANFPLKVIYSPEDIEQAKEDFAGKDLILVDTAGRSQKDAPKMSHLQQFLSALKPDEIHLVVSATSSPGVLQNILDRFEPCGIHSVILTKLDEANSFGSLISILMEKGLPISYLAHGQEVPDDLMEAKGERLAALIAGTGV
jgi:flagellar biosynthesis protein FlhF